MSSLVVSLTNEPLSLILATINAKWDTEIKKTAQKQQKNTFNRKILRLKVDTSRFT